MARVVKDGSDDDEQSSTAWREFATPPDRVERVYVFAHVSELASVAYYYSLISFSVSPLMLPLTICVILRNLLLCGLFIRFFHARLLRRCVLFHNWHIRIGPGS